LMIAWSSLLSSVIFDCPLPGSWSSRSSWSSSACSLTYLLFAIMTSCVIIRIVWISYVCGMSLLYLRQISIDPIIAASDSLLPIFFIFLSLRQRRFLNASSNFACIAPSDEITIEIISTCISRILFLS
jgi:hypothetical protein